VSFYAGGQAGSLYTSIAEKIADTLHFRFPPIFTWFNKDYYTGILQFNSFLQIHGVLKLDSYDQFLPKYSELKAKTSQEVKELRQQIESREIEKNSLKQKLSESQNEERRSRIISELRAITTTERQLKIQIQQAEHNVSLLGNAIQSFKIFPSIIDYLLSMDTFSLSEQWLHFLDTVEPPITKPQLLKTNFSNFLRSKFSWLKNIENSIEKIVNQTI
jgi:chromosome segregation ATPase